MVASWNYYFTYATYLYNSFIIKIEASIWFKDVAHMRCWANSQAKWSISVFKSIIQRRLMLSQEVLIKAMELLIALC
jgi:hypothetical protein